MEEVTEFTYNMLMTEEECRTLDFWLLMQMTSKKTNGELDILKQKHNDLKKRWAQIKVEKRGIENEEYKRR